MSDLPPEGRFRRVAILGVGLIGGSFGLALRERHLADQVVAFSRTPATRALAVTLGAADETTDTPADCVAGADLVFLATPVASLIPTLAAVADRLAPDAIVTDAGSAKQAVVESAEALGLPGLRFVGGHPMTGSEQMGVAHARADLFEGTTWAVTPTPRTDPAALARVAAVAAAVGARVLELAPADHDAAVAAISHVPHLLAAALVKLTADRAAAGQPVWDLVAGSWASATRVAASGPALWREIFVSNRAAVLEALDDFAGDLQAFRDLLAAGDDDGLEALLTATQAAKLARG